MKRLCNLLIAFAIPYHIIAEIIYDPDQIPKYFSILKAQAIKTVNPNGTDLITSFTASFFRNSTFDQSLDSWSSSDQGQSQISTSNSWTSTQFGPKEFKNI